MTGSKSSNEPGEAIRLFLLNPHDKGRFDQFFKLCRDHTIAWLRSRGHRLPLEKQAGENPVSDLAFDILGEFFKHRPGQKFCVIYDYYNRHKVTDFKQASPDKLYYMFRTLIGGFVKKALYRLGGMQNPQAENLRRRFKDVLIGDEYVQLKFSSHTIVSLREYAEDIRIGKPFLPFEELIILIEAAYLRSKNRKEWCLQIFKALNLESDYKNALKKHELIAMVVKVNSRYVDLSYRPNSFNFPDEMTMQKEIAHAISEATVHISGTVIDKFVVKGKLTEDIAYCFRQAIGHYLTDLCNGNGTDSKPTYFRLVMPEQFHDRFIPEFKHMFEATIDNSEEYLRQLLKEKSIFSKYGDYFNSKMGKG